MDNESDHDYAGHQLLGNNNVQLYLDVAMGGNSNENYTTADNSTDQESSRSNSSTPSSDDEISASTTSSTSLTTTSSTSSGSVNRAESTEENNEMDSNTNENSDIEIVPTTQDDANENSDIEIVPTTPDDTNENSDVEIVPTIQDDANGNSDINEIDETSQPGNAVVEATVPSNDSSDATDTNSPPKKRKRLLETMKANDDTMEDLNKTAILDEDHSEGSTCSICLDAWEISGEHRLASLKCGHLFGDSCIRRWLKQSLGQTGQRMCPQCKSKAHPRDIRYVYAKRVRAVDRSEEYRLTELLVKEQKRSKNLESDVATLKLKFNRVSEKLQKLEADHERLQQLIRRSGIPSRDPTGDNKSIGGNDSYKLFLERTINVSREAGCRVMIYSKERSQLIVSQKSGAGLFPGYGIRLIDVETFKPTTYLHASAKLLRDICLNNDHHMLTFTSLEIHAKTFDLRSKEIVATYKPTDKPLWSCNADSNQNEHCFYLGAQHGCVYMYDIRFSKDILKRFTPESDKSPVINVAPVPKNKTFPQGGLLVCTLNALWFYESKQNSMLHHLKIEGPFTYMEYNASQETVLVTTRSRPLCPYGRYFVGNLEKIDNCVLFNIKITFFGSKSTPVMIRSTQIPLESNTLVGAYLLDSKMLTLFNVQHEHRAQSLPVHDIVYDMCPMYKQDSTYLAALTENKCRLYKLSNN